MKSWKNISVLALSSALIIGSFLISDSSIKKARSAQTLKGGVATCMARVTQTFTALMIRDTASTFLTRDFMSMSSECLSEAQKLLKQDLSSINKDIKLSLNKISSDVHWFHDKVEGLNKMAFDNQIQLTPESNIVEKYQDLNAQSRSIGESIDSAQSSLYVNRKYAVAIGALGAMLLISFAVVTIRHRNNELKLFTSYDKEAKSIIDDRSSETETKLKTRRLLENIFVTLNASNCKKLTLDYNFSQQDEISTPLTIKPIVQAEQLAKETANLSDTLKGLIDQSCFVKNSNLEQDIHEGIIVSSSSEELSQYMKTLFSFVDDKVISHGVEKLSLVSKPLGSIAYVKLSLEDVLFTSEELEAVEQNKLASNNMNLLLLTEIGDELGVNITLKNLVGAGSKRSQAQIEITMPRFEQKKSSPVLKKLIKGTKKEILESMRNA